MSRIALNLVTGAVVVFLIGPLVVVTFGSLTRSPYISFPPHGITLHWYAQVWQHGDILSSFVASLIIATAASLFATAIGTIAAVALNQEHVFCRGALQAFVISPLVLPTVITGVALYDFMQNFDLPSAYPGLIIGHTVITVPYVVRTVGAALVDLDRSLPEAAASLGAGWPRILREVIIPAILPAMMVSIMLVFIVSFDQVSLSIFLSDPDTTPLPIRLYSYLEFGLDPMVGAISTLMILFAYLLVVLLERSFGLGRLFSRG